MLRIAQEIGIKRNALAFSQEMAQEHHKCVGKFSSDRMEVVCDPQSNGRENTKVSRVCVCIADRECQDKRQQQGAKVCCTAAWDGFIGGWSSFEGISEESSCDLERLKTS